MYQPYPSSGQPAEPLRPPAPAPVLTAVKLMYAGAAASTVTLIIVLALIGSDKAGGHLRWNGHTLTAAQLSHLRPLIITVTIVSGLVVPALWMARANGQGRNWARILSTVLFGLATLQLTGIFKAPVSHVGFGVEMLLGLIVPVLTWLVGLVVVWRKPLDQVLPAALAAGVGIIARVPLASGLLSGRYTHDTTFAAGDHRSYNRHGEAFDAGETFSGVDFDTGVDAAREFATLAPPAATPAQAALAWVIQQPGVSTVIPGARSPGQARQNAAAAGLPPFTDAQLSVIQAIYDRRIRAQVHHRW
jgi:hypothetical protein